MPRGVGVAFASETDLTLTKEAALVALEKTLRTIDGPYDHGRGVLRVTWPTPDAPQASAWVGPLGRGPSPRRVVVGLRIERDDVPGEAWIANLLLRVARARLEWWFRAKALGAPPTGSVRLAMPDGFTAYTGGANVKPTKVTRGRTDAPQPWAATLTFKGRTMTIAKWSGEIGVGNDTIRRRLSLGLPIEEVLAPSTTRRKITFNGKTQSPRAWAKELGVSGAVLHYRLGKLPLEVALAPVSAEEKSARITAIRVKTGATKTYELDGRTFTLPELAKERGLREITVRGRLARGYTLAEATVPPLSREQCVEKALQARGVVRQK